jgi:LDH2 family malate/lactate/ureidoglycolate dehydrogenase
MKRIPSQALATFTTDILEAVDVPLKTARSVAENLVLADLRGIETHGVRRLPSYVAQVRDGTIRPCAEFTIQSSFEAGCCADGGRGFGQTIARSAMDVAIDKAKQTGIAGVTVANGGHIGAHGNIVLQAVEAGQFGLVVTCGRPVMAAPGATAAAVGLTPFAIGCPSGHDFPLVLDIALSVAARGHILRALAEGTSIPESWAVDAAGDPTTDPEAALNGALLPVGGYKGYGLAVMMSALAGLLTGALDDAALSSDDADTPPFAQGHFVMAIDIARFVPVAVFQRRAEAFVDAIKAAPKAAGIEEIFLPGEQSWRRWQDRRQNGIPLSDSLVAELKELGTSMGIRFEPDSAAGPGGTIESMGATAS